MKATASRHIASLATSLALVFVVGAILVPTPVLSQTNETLNPSEVLDQNLSASEREAVLARLSDEQVRDIVWDLIGDAQSASTPSDPVVMELTAITNRFRDGMAERLRQVPVIARVPGIIATAMKPPGAGAGTPWLVVLYIMGASACGLRRNPICFRQGRNQIRAQTCRGRGRYPGPGGSRRGRPGSSRRGPVGTRR